MVYRITSTPQLAAVLLGASSVREYRVLVALYTEGGELRLTAQTELVGLRDTADAVLDFVGSHQQALVLVQTHDLMEAVPYVRVLTAALPREVTVGSLAGSDLLVDGQLHNLDEYSVELPPEMRQRITPLTLWAEDCETEHVGVRPVAAEPVATVTAFREAVQAGQKPDLGLLAQLGSQFADVRTRDLVLETALGADPADAYARSGEAFRRAIWDADARWPEQTVWLAGLRYVAEHVDQDVAGGAWAVLAAYAWITGALRQADHAVEQALDFDEDEGLAKLVRKSLAEGLNTQAVQKALRG